MWSVTNVVQWGFECNNKTYIRNLHVHKHCCCKHSITASEYIRHPTLASLTNPAETQMITTTETPSPGLQTFKKAEARLYLINGCSVCKVWAGGWGDTPAGPSSSWEGCWQSPTSLGGPVRGGVLPRRLLEAQWSPLVRRRRVRPKV